MKKVIKELKNELEEYENIEAQLRTTANEAWKEARMFENIDRYY